MVKKITNIIGDAAPDLGEQYLDEASTVLAKELLGVVLPEFAKELPVIKYIKTGSDVYSVYKVNKLQRRLKAFLGALIDGKFVIEDFYKLTLEEQRQVIDILVTELDNQSDDYQSEAMGYLFNAYITGKLHRLTFLGIAHELKNTNPLVFYFNVDGYKLAQNMGGTEIELGPINYLPSAFITASTDKVITATGHTFLTKLGEAFFENVYEPMSQKYLV